MPNMGTPFYQEYMKKGTPANRAFNTLTGLNSVRQMKYAGRWTSGSRHSVAWPPPAAWRNSTRPAWGWMNYGYSLPPCAGWMQDIVIDGRTTLKTPNRLSAASCMTRGPGRPQPRHSFAWRLGHAGAGGSHAFADPVCGLSFATR